MAKLHNTQFITTNAKAWEGINDTVKTVGHNRTVRFEKGTLTCYLHGHAIVKIREMKALGGGGRRLLVELDTCGYKTPTTRQAMSDFTNAYGFSFEVGFAKGRFGIRYKNTHIDAVTDQYGYSERETDKRHIMLNVDPVYTVGV